MTPMAESSNARKGNQTAHRVSVTRLGQSVHFGDCGQPRNARDEAPPEDDFSWRPSELQVERKRWARNRPGTASSRAKGERSLRQKLESISTVMRGIARIAQRGGYHHGEVPRLPREPRARRRIPDRPERSRCATLHRRSEAASCRSRTKASTDGPLRIVRPRAKPCPAPSHPQLHLYKRVRFAGRDGWPFYRTARCGPPAYPPQSAAPRLHPIQEAGKS